MSTDISMSTEAAEEPPPPGAETSTPEVIKSKSVHLADDLVGRQTFEYYEMKRLGLPIRFGKESSKFRKRKRKSSDDHDHHVRGEDNRDGGMSVDDNDDDNDEELVRNISTISLEEVNGDGKGEDVGDEIEEVSTIRLSNDPTDYLDIDVVENCTTIPPSVKENSKSKTKTAKKKKNKSKSKSLKDVYYRQRYILFSKYDDGIQLDQESWYSVTPESIARHIAEKVQQSLLLSSKFEVTGPGGPPGKLVIMDGFCGAGGNAIQFALQPSTALVLAVDIDPSKIELARNNARIYGCLDKIEFIVGNFLEIIENFRKDDQRIIDCCFLSPPWGGREYLQKSHFSLADMRPDGFEILEKSARYLTGNICFLLPRNFDQSELERMSKIINRNRNCTAAATTNQSESRVEIEENRIFDKVKTMTAYFGDLVQGS